MMAHPTAIKLLGTAGVLVPAFLFFCCLRRQKKKRAKAFATHQRVVEDKARHERELLERERARREHEKKKKNAERATLRERAPGPPSAPGPPPSAVTAAAASGRVGRGASHQSLLAAVRMKQGGGRSRERPTEVAKRRRHSDDSSARQHWRKAMSKFRAVRSFSTRRHSEPTPPTGLQVQEGRRSSFGDRLGGHRASLMSVATVQELHQRKKKGSTSADDMESEIRRIRLEHEVEQRRHEIAQKANRAKQKANLMRRLQQRKRGGKSPTSRATTVMAPTNPRNSIIEESHRIQMEHELEKFELQTAIDSNRNAQARALRRKLKERRKARGTTVKGPSTPRHGRGGGGSKPGSRATQAFGVGVGLRVVPGPQSGDRKSSLTGAAKKVKHLMKISSSASMGSQRSGPQLRRQASGTRSKLTQQARQPSAASMLSRHASARSVALRDLQVEEQAAFSDLQRAEEAEREEMRRRVAERRKNRAAGGAAGRRAGGPKMLKRQASASSAAGMLVRQGSATNMLKTRGLKRGASSSSIRGI